MHACAWRAVLPGTQPQRPQVQHRQHRGECATPGWRQPELAGGPGRRASVRAGESGGLVMSRTISRSREAGQRAEGLVSAEAGWARGRGRWVALGVALVVAAGAVAGWQAGGFSPAASSGAGQGAPAPGTTAVTRQDIAATTPVNATLGYAGSYPGRGQGGGTLTWLPSAGQVISQGQALYQTGNGSPVVLL